MAKRRANGEGNIRKRKDGRWEGRYTAGYDTTTGKRIIKNVLGKTQAEVKEKLAQAIDSTKDLDVARSDDYTVATWLAVPFPGTEELLPSVPDLEKGAPVFDRIEPSSRGA